MTTAVAETSARRALGTWLRHHRWSLAAVVAALVLSWAHGLIGRGRAFPLQTMAFVNGWTTCLSEGSLPCPYLGQPLGVRIVIGWPHYAGTYLLDAIGVRPAQAMNLLATGSVVLGSLALAWVVRRLGLPGWCGVAAAVLYYGSPVVVGHRGLASLYFAFALAPVPLAAMVEGVRAASERATRRWIAAGLVGAAGATLVVFSDPYGWMLVMVLAGGLCLVALVHALRYRHRQLAIGSVANLAALVAPGGVYAVTIGPGATSSMPRDFHRAMGVDLAVMFVPTPDTWLHRVFWLPFERWDASRFYGDGTNLRAYFGVVTLLAAIAGTVVLVRRGGSIASIAAGLALGGILCLLLGLGPSLKVNDTAPRPIGADGIFTFDDYLMPAGDATVSLPWAGVFGVQPVESVRATYRWHVGLRLAAALLIPGALAAVTRIDGLARRRIALGGLGLLLVLDTGSSRLWNAQRNARQDARMLLEFHRDIDATFAGSLQPNERVLFLPAENDFLLMDVASRFGVRAWNIALDKEIARIRRSQPEEVRQAIRAYEGGKFDSEMACRLFEQQLVDVLVLMHFNARWDSYRWPPGPVRVEAQREVAWSTGVPENPVFTAEDRGFATFVRLTPGASCHSD